VKGAESQRVNGAMVIRHEGSFSRVRMSFGSTAGRLPQK
jgi:hypothetical protein